MTVLTVRHPRMFLAGIHIENSYECKYIYPIYNKTAVFLCVVDFLHVDSRHKHAGMTVCVELLNSRHRHAGMTIYDDKAKLSSRFD